MGAFQLTLLPIGRGVDLHPSLDTLSGVYFLARHLVVRSRTILPETARGSTKECCVASALTLWVVALVVSCVLLCIRLGGECTAIPYTALSAALSVEGLVLYGLPSMYLMVVHCYDDD